MDKECHGPYPPATSGVTINLHLLHDFRRLETHFLDTILAAARVSTLRSSVASSQDFAMRFEAGIGWVAF